LSWCAEVLILAWSFEYVDVVSIRTWVIDFAWPKIIWSVLAGWGNIWSESYKNVPFPCRQTIVLRSRSNLPRAWLNKKIVFGHIRLILILLINEKTLSSIAKKIRMTAQLTAAWCVVLWGKAFASIFIFFVRVILRWKRLPCKLMVLRRVKLRR